jgi:hypothetical protein
MLLLKNNLTAVKRRTRSENEHARSQLEAARKGELPLFELQQMDLSRNEVARFLSRRIPILMAAAHAGHYTGAAIFLEEMHQMLVDDIRSEGT